MAKNTSSSAFRKIDVDEYNEDNYKDDEHEPVSSSLISESEVNGLIMQQRFNEALHYCLSHAPLNEKNQEIKDAATATILRVLLTIKQSQIEDSLAKLDTEQVDTLMKYIYRGFEIPSEGSSGHLLAWHEKVFAIGGIGSITRVLTDRKRV